MDSPFLFSLSYFFSPLFPILFSLSSCLHPHPVPAAVPVFSPPWLISPLLIFIIQGFGFEVSMGSLIKY